MIDPGALPMPKGVPPPGPGGLTPTASGIPSTVPAVNRFAPTEAAAHEKAQRRGRAVVRTVSDVSSLIPLSPSGSIGGAYLKRLQALQPADYMNPLTPIAALGQAHGDVYGPIVDAARQQGPGAIIPAIHEAARHNLPFDQETEAALEQGGGPIGAVAHQLREHPYVNAGLAFGATALDPVANAVMPGGRLFKAGAEVTRLAPAMRALARAGAKVPGVEQAGAAAGETFNRYHGLGPNAEGVLAGTETRMQSAGRLGTPRPGASRQSVNGESFKIFGNTTQAQEIEIAKRAARGPNGEQLYPGDPNVPEPKGLSLNLRAARLRATLTKRAVRGVQSGVLKPEELHDVGTFFPMARYGEFSAPYNEDWLKSISSPTATEGMDLQSVAESQLTGRHARAGFGTRNPLRGNKILPDVHELPPEALAKTFSPAKQFEQHGQTLETAIARADTNKEFLEAVPIEVGGDHGDYRYLIRTGMSQGTIPLDEGERVLKGFGEPGMAPARIPKVWINPKKDPNTGDIQVFGIGEEAQAKATADWERRRQARATFQAADAIHRPDLPFQRRSPWESITALKQLAKGRLTGALQVGKLGEMAAQAGERIAPGEIPPILPARGTVQGRWTQSPYVAAGNVSQVPLPMLLKAQGNVLGKTDVDRLASEIAERGLDEPLILKFDPKSGLAALGEGNHRAAALARLGYDAAPVRALRATVHPGDPGAIPLPSAHLADRNGYIPSDLSPEKLGIAAPNSLNVPAAGTAALAKPNGFQNAAQLTRDAMEQARMATIATQRDLQRNVAPLTEKIAGNATAMRDAQLEARAARMTAQTSDFDQQVLGRIQREAPQSPTKTAIRELATNLWRQERTGRNPEQEVFEGVFAPKSVEPSWVWEDRRWKLAGEYADVPKKFIDLKTRPKGEPTSANSIQGRVIRSLPQNANNTLDAKIQQLQSELGREVTEDDVMNWMSSQRREAQKTVGDFMLDAGRHLEAQLLGPHTERTNAELARLGLSGMSTQAAQEKLRQEVIEMKALADKATTEYRQRRFAGREFGPPAAAVAGAVERAGPRLSEAMAQIREAQAQANQEIRAGQQQASTEVIKVANAAKRTTQKNVFDMEQIANRLADARVNAADREALEQKRNLILKQSLRSVAENVNTRYGRLPTGPAGETLYVDESGARLGARDAGQFGLYKPIAEKLAEPIYDPRGEFSNEAKWFGRMMDTAATLQRFGIISTGGIGAHLLGNVMLSHFFRYKNPLAIARILTGQNQAVWDPHWVDRAEKAGALPAFGFDTFGHYDRQGLEGTKVRNAAMSELNPLERADRLASKYGRFNAWVVFDSPIGERGFAIDAFRRNVLKGMSDLDAARAVRKDFGDYGNITSKERSLGLQKMFLFYPWMKTAIARWTKAGVLDPQWNLVAPARGVEALNTNQGYDDPTQPFTITRGRTESGDVERLSLPIPQRIVERVGRTLAIPFDVGEGLATGDYGGLKGDVTKGPAAELLNRLAPLTLTGALVNTTAELGKNYGKGPTAQGLIGDATSNLVAPLRTLAMAKDDPLGAAIQAAGLGFAYNVPGGTLSQKDVTALMDLIRGYRAQGRGPEADAMLEWLRNQQGLPPQK